MDLLDRLLIIRTVPYTLEEIKTILYTRAKVESIEVEEPAFLQLAEIGVKGSLRYFEFDLESYSLIRYAIQLLTPASVLCKINGRQVITPEDVDEVHSLFLDAKASVHVLQNSQGFIL